MYRNCPVQHVTHNKLLNTVATVYLFSIFAKDGREPLKQAMMVCDGQSSVLLVQFHEENLPALLLCCRGKGRVIPPPQRGESGRAAQASQNQTLGSKAWEQKRQKKWGHDWSLWFLCHTRKKRESGIVVLEEDLGINSAGVRINYHLPAGHVGQVSSSLSVPVCKMESMLPASELLLKMKWGHLQSVSDSMQNLVNPPFLAIVSGGCSRWWKPSSLFQKGIWSLQNHEEGWKNILRSGLLEQLCRIGC